MNSIEKVAVAATAALALTACGGGGDDTFKAETDATPTFKTYDVSEDTAEATTEDVAEVTSAPVEATEEAVEVTEPPTEEGALPEVTEDSSDAEAGYWGPEDIKNGTDEISVGTIEALEAVTGYTCDPWDGDPEVAIAQITFCEDATGENGIFGAMTFYTGYDAEAATQMLTNMVLSEGFDEEFFISSVPPQFAFLGTDEGAVDNAAVEIEKFMNENTEPEHGDVSGPQPDDDYVYMEAPAEFLNALPELSEAECDALWSASYGGWEPLAEFSMPYISDLNADAYGATEYNMLEWFTMYAFNACPM